MKECSSPLSGLGRCIPAVLIILAAPLGLRVASPFAVAQTSAAPNASSTSIRTPDYDESIRWYQDKLGFRLIADRDFVQGRTAVLERSGFLLEVTEVDRVLQGTNDSDSTGRIEVTRTPVITLLVSDVDEEIRRLRKSGVEVLMEPQDELDGRYRTAQIRDNGRHRIELREPIHDSGGFNPTGR